MRRILDLGRAAAVTLTLLTAWTFAAPAAPSHQPILNAIEHIRSIWRDGKLPTDANIQAWETFFNALQSDLKLAGTATSFSDRTTAFTRLKHHDEALGVIAWAPVGELRNSLKEWLSPRLALVEAERQLREKLATISPVTDPTGASYRDRWIQFVDTDLDGALREYEKAATVSAKVQGLDRLHASLAALNKVNTAHPWAPTVALHGALTKVYDQPNLDISADVNSLVPFLGNNLITTGPVYRKGYVSQVTAGQHLGFGLMASDDGIAFYNKQLMTTYTPIHDFQRQITSDERGQRVAKMYQFVAASYDSPELTIIGVIRPSGLSLIPQYTHAIGASINAYNQPGGGAARAIAALVGFNKGRITKEVYNGAIGKIRSGIVQEAMDEGTQRTAAEAANRTQQLSKFLVGNNTLAISPELAITQLSLRSRPENALVHGKLIATHNISPLGADTPQPASLYAPDPGVSADLHLGSILNELAQSVFHNPKVVSVNNVMIELKKPDVATPTAPKVGFIPNASFEQFQAAVGESKKSLDPAVTAIRITKPAKPPEFAADAEGNLVVLINNLQVDIPAPGDKVYRVKSPQTEVILNFAIVPNPGTSQVKASMKLVDLNFGTRATVSQITSDEGDGRPVPFSGVFLNLARGTLRNRLFEVPIDASQLRGFSLKKVYPLDPSGWIRVVLGPGGTVATPASSAQATPAPAAVSTSEPTAPL